MSAAGGPPYQLRMRTPFKAARNPIHNTFPAFRRRRRAGPAALPRETITRATEHLPLSRSAGRQAEAMPNRFVPVDHAIVGIVDAVEELAGGGAPGLPAARP